MKKILIVAVCLALVLTLAFTLGALGKKPDKPPGKPEYVNYELTFEGPYVTGTVYQCGVQGGFISSSNIDEYRPTLTLNPDTFGKYGGEHDGQYLDLREHEGDITMQFFFFDQNDEKVQLNVYYGYVFEGEDWWLSEEFTIVFYDTDAKITPTKGKKFPPLWYYGHVNITIECVPQE